MNITTGLGDDTVNVLATGVPTNLSSSGGHDTVNVGNAGSVQGVLEAVFIQNPLRSEIAGVATSLSARVTKRSGNLT